MIRRLTAALAAIALLLSSCLSMPASDKPVKLVFWTTTSETETPFFQERIDAFEAEHPNIEVEVVRKGFPYATNEYKTAILGGQTVDIFRADNSWIPEYAELELLYPLDRLADEQAWSGFVPAALSAVTYQEHVYGLPSVMEVPALLYNRTLLQAGGFSKPPATMDELLLMAQAMTGSGRYGLYITEDSYFALPFLWAFGGGTVTEEREIEIDSPASREALAFMRQLWTSGVAQPSTLFDGWYDRMMQDFGAGKSAMIINGPWAVSDLLKSPAFANSRNLGIAPVPKGPGGQGSPIGGHSLVISRYSAHPEESYELIRYLTSPETQVLQSLAFQTLPTQEASYRDPRLAAEKQLQEFKAQLQVAKSLPMIPENAKLYRDFTSNLNAMLLGRLSIEEGMQRIANAWRILLNLE